MKVLWFLCSGISSGTYRTFWVSCLLQELSKQKEIELGICFLTNDSSLSAYKENGVSYFPVNSKRSYLAKTINRLTHKDNESTNFNDYLTVVAAFKPDLINIFGTENEQAKIIPLVKCKVVIHTQGILSPYMEYWHLPNTNNRNVFWISKPLYLLLGFGFYHYFIKRKKDVIREKEMLSHARYVFGRTDWDKTVLSVLAPKASYLHVDEVLRDEFFNATWKYIQNDTIQLVSIIGDDLFKGYDMVLKTAELLEKEKIKFNWKIFGINTQSESVRIIEKLLKIKRSANIELMGHGDATKIIGVMIQSHLYVHPSKVENSPNSVCEAMLVGMPVIAPYTGGINTIITDKVTGLLFQNLDYYMLAGLIINTVKDPSKMAELGKQAKIIAMKRHEKDKIVSDLISAYKTIIAS